MLWHFIFHTFQDGSGCDVVFACHHEFAFRLGQTLASAAKCASRVQVVHRMSARGTKQSGTRIAQEPWQMGQVMVVVFISCPFIGYGVSVAEGSDIRQTHSPLSKVAQYSQTA